MDRPHVLLINTDHWSGRLLGCAGHPVIRTPTLDALARDGIRFSSCYSTCPVCIPARRSLMTSLSPRSHGDRVYSDRMPMPQGVTTLAQAFRDGGYQAVAVGKLHVYPQRNRIGFDEVILSEEARYEFGGTDDYEDWLARHGYLGLEYAHGMSNNQYFTRPWHLPEEAHATTWATRQMIRQIKRRDPTRPSFFYLSYIHPHPPLVPLRDYLDMYPPEAMDEPVCADWDREETYALQYARRDTAGPDAVYGPREIREARRAFYAQCTHIDHQLRLVIGTLKEEGLLDRTILAFTSDHGDMLFDHGMTGKRLFYDGSCRVPLILSGKPLQSRRGEVNPALACLEDIMPTLLTLCGLPVPETCEGIDLLGDPSRDLLYAEIDQTRMVTDGRYKLIYYAVGNRTQLFDLENDPRECCDLAGLPACAGIRRRLEDFLIRNLYGRDEAWVQDGRLVGLPDHPCASQPNYTLSNQRGLHWPPPAAR